ncbi:MAG: alginate lyase family protein [Pseudomonadota bacterium]|nr:alginate lyase family protein [Pseudomonadota bacterium]
MLFKRVFVGAACLIAALCQARAGATAQPLQAPFLPHPAGGHGAGTACIAAPPPPVTLSITSRYGADGPRRDTVDDAAATTEKAQMAPLRDFGQRVAKMANVYTRSGDSGAAVCALAWLDAWASGNALSQMHDANAQFERGSLLAGFSLALMQIDPAIATDPRRARVVAWMRQQAQAMVGYFNATHQLKGSRNNHLYWAGLAAAGVAVVSDDRTMLAWSAKTYRDAVCGATGQGGLPLELQRGKKARDYHLFALNALVPLAAILEKNGIAAFAECDGAVHRIVHFSLKAADDPAALALLAGAQQQPLPGGVALQHQFAFMEIYRRAFPGKAPFETCWLALRPLKSSSLGGDQTLLYAQ